MTAFPCSASVQSLVQEDPGHQHYFGKILPDDPKGEQALQRYLDQRDDLHAGRKPRPKCDESLTVEPHQCVAPLETPAR